MPKLLCLDSDDASLVLELRENAAPVWRHCGVRINAAGIPTFAQIREPASFSLDQDEPLSTAPPAGLGWFGEGTVGVSGGDGQPCVFVPESCAATQGPKEIALTLLDPVAGIELQQTITAMKGGAFRFGNSIRNIGTESVRLGRLASALLPLPPDSKSIISWRGRHNAELVECCEPMPEHGWIRRGRRGISGHGGAPGLYVLTEGASRHRGLVFALQLAWSGDSSLSVERDDEGFWTLCVEADLGGAGIVLEPGESFSAAPAILAISASGRNGAMAQHHAAVRAMLDWAGGDMPPRPVHLNSWEAFYFGHDETRIGDLAERAAAVGAERFVLDDGWFQGRDDDTSSLGDWTADPVKYPRGLNPLAARVVQLGMEFGLWVEPEMVSPKSDLYRAHPDWALALPRRARPTGRGQFVLDMSRSDVRDYLFEVLDRLLTDHPISYLKWDHNRDLAPSGGAAQTLGTYALLARLRTTHPDVEFEGCAGGGGRSDAGLVPFVHRFWSSDCLDAVTRIDIQRSFLAFLPPEMMGSHIGASPAHATGREQSMPFRAAIACMGHLGVELDPDTLTERDQAELTRWITFYKRWRHISLGTNVHLGEGADGLVWQAQGNGQDWLLFAIRSTPAQDRRPQPIKLPFAELRRQWDVRLLELAQQDGGPTTALPTLFHTMEDSPARFTGSWLAKSGLPLPPQHAESVAIFHLQNASDGET